MAQLDSDKVSFIGAKHIHDCSFYLSKSNDSHNDVYRRVEHICTFRTLRILYRLF
jgi:hypothetical protein